MRAGFRKATLFLWAVATCLAVAMPARASFMVAYINATGGSVDYLTSYGIDVTYLNNPTGLTLAQLSSFDAVLISPNAGFTEASHIGDVVADYADAGGGVVLTAFDLFAFGGRIMTADYSPLNLISTANYVNTATLGTIYDAASPILDGVNPLLTTTQYDVQSGLNPNGVLVADWGATNLGGPRPAVAYTPLANSSVVFVNLFPRGDTISSDAGHMVANALKFSAGPATPGDPNAVPEPASLLLAASGAVLFLGRFRRKSAA
jgi:hypothetical protein